MYSQWSSLFWAVPVMTVWGERSKKGFLGWQQFALCVRMWGISACFRGLQQRDFNGKTRVCVCVRATEG